MVEERIVLCLSVARLKMVTTNAQHDVCFISYGNFKYMLVYIGGVQTDHDCASGVEARFAGCTYECPRGFRKG